MANKVIYLYRLVTGRFCAYIVSTQWTDLGSISSSTFFSGSILFLVFQIVSLVGGVKTWSSFWFPSPFLRIHSEGSEGQFPAHSSLEQNYSGCRWFVQRSSQNSFLRNPFCHWSDACLLHFLILYGGAAAS